MLRALQLLLSVSIIFSSFPVSAQYASTEVPFAKQLQTISSIADTPKKIKSLSVGDRVPDIEFKVVNYSKPTVKLNDFKGKLVILDFWATWCWSCVASFPKMDKLQQKFKDQIQVILVNSEEVTGDNQAKVMRLIEKTEANEGKPFPLMMAIEDSLANRLFPHYGIPHYAWVMPSGVVRAITFSEDVTEANIRQMLEDETMQLPVKKDFFPEQLLDLSLNGAPTTISKDLAYYSIFKKGRLDGLDVVNEQQIDRVANVNRGIAMRNIPLLEMYEKALVSKYKIGNYNRKRLALEVHDPSKLIFNSAQGEKENWEKENLYTYDLIIPAQEIENIPDYMIRDLNIYSGYYGRVEKRKVKCLLLVETNKTTFKDSKAANSIESSIADGKHYLKNAPGYLIASILNRHPDIKFPVINKSKSIIVPNLVLDLDNLTVKKVKEQLSPFGLSLIEAEQVLDMLIISDKNKLERLEK